MAQPPAYKPVAVGCALQALARIVSEGRAVLAPAGTVVAGTVAAGTVVVGTVVVGTAVVGTAVAVECADAPTLAVLVLSSLAGRVSSVGFLESGHTRGQSRLHCLVE